MRYNPDRKSQTLHSSGIRRAALTKSKGITSMYVVSNPPHVYMAMLIRCASTWLFLCRSTCLRFESLKEDKPEDKIVPMSPLYWAESPRNGSYHNHLERASSKYDDVDGSTVQTPPNGNVPSWAQYDFPQQHREDASASGPVSPGVPIAEAVVMESLFGQQPVRTICFLYGVYSVRCAGSFLGGGSGGEN